MISKNIPPLVIRLVINSYGRQEARVSWGMHMFGYFRLITGVKQGGVISAQLFTLYIVKLLDLKQSGYDCHMDNTFTIHLSNTDDISLISLSLKGMNFMLQICSNFAEYYSKTFTSKISICS